LKKLKKMDIGVGILTNVPYGLGNEYYEKFTSVLCDYCDVFLTSVEIGFRKPNQRGYYEVARRLGVNTEDCIFVGDEEVDIVGANISGMKSILVDRKGNNHQYGQIHTIQALDDVLKLI